ncbi:MAG: histidine phosphatase family protein [Bacilli bacterium]|nr:histidine phosphatase family protein [Bacilli bacterium]
MKIYVVRHGETEMGKNKLIASKEEPLNKNGKIQAIRVGEKLRQLDINMVFSSPIKRVIDTLDLFNLDKKIPVFVDKRLEERNMGLYEGVSFEDLDWKEFWSYSSQKKYPELESMKSVYERTVSFLNEIKVKYYDKSILLVTHGGIKRAIDWYCYGIDSTLLECENAKIYEYSIEESSNIKLRV